MTTISTTSGLITLTNVFTVELANQRRLIELLTEATEVSVRRAPALFRPASIAAQTAQRSRCTHSGGASSITRRCARTLAQLPFLQEAPTIAKFEPGIYEVVRTFAPAGEPN
jgi:hypothetical protein